MHVVILIRMSSQPVPATSVVWSVPVVVVVVSVVVLVALVLVLVVDDDYNIVHVIISYNVIIVQYVPVSFL